MHSIHTERERECGSLVLRRLEREDRDRLATLFAGLSAESRFKHSQARADPDPERLEGGITHRVRSTVP
jgi:hypothetical protein